MLQTRLSKLQGAVCDRAYLVDARKNVRSIERTYSQSDALRAIVASGTCETLTYP